MPINFDALPDKMTYSIPPKGLYYALIEKAEMKNSPDPKKSPYLNLTYALTDANGKASGKLFDMISEPNHDLTRFKLRRFIEALGINITGNFELKDIAKVAAGKRILVDVTEDKKSDQPRATVDVFHAQIYYHISEAGQRFQTVEGAVINAPDAEDATPNNTDTPTEVTY